MQRLKFAHGGALIAAVQCPSFLTATAPRRGLEQMVDVPTSSTRTPSGLHAGPNKRVMNRGEKERFQFIRKWQLQMEETWDNFEAFKGQPKPKRQFGNEACEVIWPYAMLMENQIHIHRFTKSIYVYYPQRQETADGAFAAAVAKRFSQQYLIPITFHNSQCYVETEMLVEYGEVPWVVIHCLDGKHKILPIRSRAPAATAAEGAAASSSSSGAAAASFAPIDVKAAAEDVMNDVVAAAEELGNSVANVGATLTALHERPLQNQYLRINYQWYGDTQEDRSSHLVQWNFDPKKTLPTTKYVDAGVRNRLNIDGRYPVANGSKANAMAQRGRIVRGAGDGTGAGALRSGQGARQNARYSQHAIRGQSL